MLQSGLYCVTWFDLVCFTLAVAATCRLLSAPLHFNALDVAFLRLTSEILSNAETGLSLLMARFTDCCILWWFYAFYHVSALFFMQLVTALTSRCDPVLFTLAAVAAPCPLTDVQLHCIQWHLMCIYFYASLLLVLFLPLSEWPFYVDTLYGLSL